MLSRWFSGDDVVELEDGARRDHERHDHREARVDRAGDEVRRKDGRVPPGQLRDREVEADDAVNREDERRRQTAEDEVADPVVSPVPRVAAPPEREDSVDASLAEGRARGHAQPRGPGSRPEYQKRSETVRYVLTATTSQGSDDLKFGHTPISDG